MDSDSVQILQTADSLEKTLMLRKTEGRRRRGQQRMRWSYGITDSRDLNLGKLQETGRNRELACRSSWDIEESDTTWRLNTINNNTKSGVSKYLELGKKLGLKFGEECVDYTLIFLRKEEALYF